MDVELLGGFAIDGLPDFLNSIARWRACSEPTTWPVVMLSAAYRLELPARL